MKDKQVRLADCFFLPERVRFGFRREGGGRRTGGDGSVADIEGDFRKDVSNGYAQRDG